jgi:hypothetical protein
LKKIQRTCRLCRKLVKMMVDPKDLSDWKTKKKYIQDAMPYLDKDEREILISKTCGKCFAKIFPYQEDN